MHVHAIMHADLLQWCMTLDHLYKLAIQISFSSVCMYVMSTCSFQKYLKFIIV